MNENEKNKYNIEIGSIIRNYRKNKKITQIKLAEKVGLGIFRIFIFYNGYFG